MAFLTRPFGASNLKIESAKMSVVKTTVLTDTTKYDYTLQEIARLHQHDTNT